MISPNHRQAKRQQSRTLPNGLCVRWVSGRKDDERVGAPWQRKILADWPSLQDCAVTGPALQECGKVPLLNATWSLIGATAQ